MKTKNQNTTGIDSEISDIQDLFDLFLGWENVAIFGRVYRNASDRGVIPEVYLGNGEYRTPHLEDRSGVVFFIDGLDHESEEPNDFTADLKIVFILDLGKIYNTREDSSAHEKIIDVLERRKSYHNFKITGIEKGRENVMSGFESDYLKHIDIQPYHIFAIKGKINYSLNVCCNG